MNKNPTPPNVLPPYQTQSARPFHLGRIGLVFALALLLSTIGLMPVHAAPRGIVLVTKAADTNDGICDSDCSLREAIAAANASDTINFSGDSAIVLSLGELFINKDLTIDGTGHTVSVSGNDAVRVFDINDATVSISHLTITRGFANASNGGGLLIENGAHFTLDNSTISFNHATYDGGGMRSNLSTTTITNSTFTKNIAGTFGGGLALVGGSATVSGSTFTQDKANTGAGAFADTGSDFLIIANSTFYKEKGVTGVLASRETISIFNVTVYNPLKKQSNYGMYLYATARYSLVNTIVAGNFAIDCMAVVGAEPGDVFNNLVQDKTCIKGTPHAHKGDPLLGKLKNNGGPTKTLALLNGSPAINKGADTSCAAFPVNGVDQRGNTRPNGTHCDLGAYER